MIRLFTALCKVLLTKISEEEAFYAATEESGMFRTSCPKCGTVGRFSEYGNYDRGHVTYSDDEILDSRVRPRRVKCLSCGATHSILPDTLTPYSPYTLRFKLLVLIAYSDRDTTVMNVCGRFGIAVSTLYEWKKIMTAHKNLMLGLLLGRKTQALGFLCGLLGSADISDTLQGFFNKYSFSFMQDASVSVTRPVPT
jgi:hypothetical protein